MLSVISRLNAVENAVGVLQPRVGAVELEMPRMRFKIGKIEARLDKQLRASQGLDEDNVDEALPVPSAPLAPAGLAGATGPTQAPPSLTASQAEGAPLFTEESTSPTPGAASQYGSGANFKDPFNPIFGLEAIHGPERDDENWGQSVLATTVGTPRRSASPAPAAVSPVEEPV